MSLVKTKREEAGLSIAEAARRAGMLTTKLWKIEHGERRLTVEDCARLAIAFGCQPQELIPTFPEKGPCT